MRKFIAVYERNSKVFVRSSSLAPNGMWVEVGECTVLSLDAASEAISESVRDHLDRSRTLDPKTHGGSEALFQAAGVSSWAAFGKGSKRVTVSAVNDQIIITPSDRNGRSYSPAAADALTIAANSDAKLLGETVLRALSNSS